MAGKKNWYFADGYLPEKVDNGLMEAHEALMFFNPSGLAVQVELSVFFSDRAPFKGIIIDVPAERVISIRLDNPADLGGALIPPLTQYALQVSASAPIVCQFGRVDTTQQALAYYVGVGYCED
ncbi:MAG: sensory rhodopsin transducer [Lentisphaeria bacterium]|jgi:hypothetical protein|nr:sensory rhodopsin transducer [Lentisphaeria bacterium]MDY0175569.1 sensory rhodopsin transducer [Lentisphaeria bacterium]NLZ60613.1 hypothetical protein [Lentisphaerota bacterium]